MTLSNYNIKDVLLITLEKVSSLRTLTFFVLPDTLSGWLIIADLVFVAGFYA